MINEEALEKAMSEIWEIESRFRTYNGAEIQKAIKDALEEEGISIEKERDFMHYIRNNIQTINKQTANGNLYTTYLHNGLPILESSYEVIDFTEMKLKFTIRKIK